MRNVYQFCLLAILAVTLTSCSGGGSPILPNQDSLNSASTTNINNTGSPSGNPFEGIPVDEPYDNYTIHCETFSISTDNGFQRKGLVYGLNVHEVISHLNSVQMDDISSTATVEFSLHNTGSIIYDAHLVIDEILPSGSELVDIDGFTPEGKPFWNFGIVPAGKISPVRNLQIKFSSNQDISVSGHVEFKERAYIQWNDLILHTDGFDGNDVVDSPDYGRIVSNEVIAGIPEGSNISDLYDYLKGHNLMPVGCDTSIGSLELRILNKTNPVDVLAGLKSDSYLTHPEPNYVGSIEFYPDDHVYNPLYDPPGDPNRNRWAFERVQAVEAWDWYSDGVINESGNANVSFGTVLAIVDTGMIKHKDFGLDSNDIWIMDVLGKNFINTGQVPLDDNGHGTKVAGITGAMGNNSFLMAGMAWNPIFLPIKVCDYRGYYGHYSLELGLAYLADLAFEYEDVVNIVINMSVGQHLETPPHWLNAAINYADASSNTLLCAAVGNNKNDKSYYGVPFGISADNFYPAAFDACISVGASSRLQNGGLDIEVFEEYYTYWGTNWGSTVDLCAPGSASVFTTSNESKSSYTDHFGGTSASTPFVSGAAALLWSKHPEWTKNQVRSTLKVTTEPMSLPPEKKGLLGTGRLNIYNALTEEDPLFDPVLVETIEPGGKFCIVGGYAYIADGSNGLSIIDIDPLYAWYEVKTVDTPGNANGVEVKDGYAYVVNGTSIQVIDIDPPASAHIENSTYVIQTGNISISGDFIYVTAGTDGLHILDINPPDSATFVKTVNTSGAAYDVDISGDYAFVADGNGGLQVIDVAIPSSAVIVETLDTPGIAKGVDVVGGYAYVADGWAGLEIIDIDPLTELQIENTIDTYDAQNVFVHEGFAYVGDLDSLEIIDIYPPGLAHIEESYNVAPSQIYVEDIYTFIADDSGLYVFKLW